MEARQTLKGTTVSKSFIAIMAVGVTIGLAAIASSAAKDFGNSAATQTSAVHPAAGTVLRQDNPVQSALSPAQAAKHSGRSAGNQSVDEVGSLIAVYPAAGTVLRQDYPGETGFVGGPDSDLTRALPQEIGMFDARSVREGHGA